MPKDKTIAVIIAALGVAGAMTLVALSMTENQGSLSSDNSYEESVSEKTTIHSRFRGYPLLENLTGTATDIVVAKVTGIQNVYTQDVPYTDFEVTIERGLKGSLQPNSLITVRQIGAVGYKDIVLDSDVLMNAGEEYVLFLKYVPETNTYAILGGPQGRFLIENSLVYSMDNVHPAVGDIHVKAKDKPLNDFLTEVSMKIEEGKQS